MCSVHLPYSPQLKYTSIELRPLAFQNRKAHTSHEPKRREYYARDVMALQAASCALSVSAQLIYLVLACMVASRVVYPDNTAISGNLMSDNTTNHKFSECEIQSPKTFFFFFCDKLRPSGHPTLHSSYTGSLCLLYNIPYSWILLHSGEQESFYF